METRAEHPGLCYMLFGLARLHSSLGRLVFSCLRIVGLGPHSSVITLFKHGEVFYHFTMPRLWAIKHIL